MGYLADEVPNRWRHVRGVARRAHQVGPVLDSSERVLLVQAAWLHDIGYAERATATGFHPLDGARSLRALGMQERVCALVAHHSGAWAVAELRGLSGELAEFVDERTLLRDALWYCDMTTGPDGSVVTFEERIAEVRRRRGPSHPSVRALALNLPEREAAVRRVEGALQALLLSAGG